MNSNQIAGTNEFKQLPTADISIAVATYNGLITPIIKTADQLSVVNISETVKVSIRLLDKEINKIQII